MKAVIKTGGKQYVVTENTKLAVEKLDVEQGAKIELNEVLLIADGDNVTVGSPVVEGAKVKCTVLEQKKSRKTIVFKFKRRKRYKRTRGHRQPKTVLSVDKIEI